MAKITTLFFEDTDIRYLVASEKGIMAWGSILLEAGMVTNGVVQEEEKVARILREQLAANKISTKRVMVGLSGWHSLYRIIDIPVVSDDLLPDAVKREAEKVMPVALNDVYLSYQTIPGSTSGMKVFIAAYPRDNTDRMVRTLRGAGITPYLMDLDPLVLCRLVTVPKAVVIHTGGVNLDIAIMVDRVPQVIRSLSQPGDANTVAEEIKRTIDFYNSSHEEDPIDSSISVQACGDLMYDPVYRQALANSTNYPISLMTSPLSADISFDARPYMMNIGLALRQIIPDSSIVNINALPQAYRVKPISKFNVLAPVGILVGVGVLIFMSYLVMNISSYTAPLMDEVNYVLTRTNAIKKDITTLDADVKKLQDEVNQAEAISQAISTRLDTIQLSRTKTNGDLEAIRGLLPQTVRLTNVDLSETGINMSGTSVSADEINAYATQLRDSNRFSMVLVKSIQRSGSGGAGIYNFQFLLK